MAGEFATSVGFSAVSALIDLAKAFEHIQFPHLWRMEVQHGFPLRLLRCVRRPGSSWWKTWRRRWCAREGPLSWQDAHVRPLSRSWPWFTRVDLTLKKLPWLFSVVDAVPGGRQEPPCVGTASACGSPVHGAYKGGRGPRGFLQEAGDHHKRRDDSHRRAQQSACGCSPHVHEELGVDCACGERHHVTREQEESSTTHKGRGRKQDHPTEGGRKQHHQKEEEAKQYHPER